MRLAAFVLNGEDRVGVVLGDDSIEPLPPGNDLVAIAGMTPEERQLVTAFAEAAIPLASVRLLPPVRPPSLRDFVCFERHIAAAKRSVESSAAGVPPEWYEAPTFLFMNPHSVVGTGEPIAVPPGCQLMDYELEVAAVIGKPGRDLDLAAARGAIVGYVIVNDWSARDIQSREMKVGLGPAKGKDFATTVGPWLVTADELSGHRLDDRLDLEMSVSVNGKRLGGDRLSNMAWSFEELVVYASRGAWVGAGDLLLSGTCSGGALAELWADNGRVEPPPLGPGDVVSMTVEGIGGISNPVVAYDGPGVAVPAARRLADTDAT